MSDGDNLILRGGEHHDDGHQLTGFKSNTTIRNHPGEIPVYRSTNYAGNMVRINGRTNMVISGIDFLGDIETTAVMKIDGGAQNITLTNCTIRGSLNGHGLLISPLAEGAENGNLVITHCSFITNGWASLSTDSPLHQIYMQNSSNIIENCYIQGVTNDGGGTLGIHNYVSDGHDYIFRNNFITNCSTGIGLLSRQRDVLVCNNIIVGGYSWGIATYLAENVRILNNTCVSNAAGIISQLSTNVWVENNITVGGQGNNPGGIYAYTGSDRVYVRNNLSYGNSYADYRIVGAINVVTNSNLFGVEYSGTYPNKVTNSTSLDARFLNAPAGDFRVADGSSAINAGLAQVLFSDDYGHRTRAASSWTIGAWEYIIAGPTITSGTITVGTVSVQ